jgi:hypothetical protein
MARDVMSCPSDEKSATSQKSPIPSSAPSRNAIGWKWIRFQRVRSVFLIFPPGEIQTSRVWKAGRAFGDGWKSAVSFCARKPGSSASFGNPPPGVFLPYSAAAARAAAIAPAEVPPMFRSR